MGMPGYYYDANSKYYWNPQTSEWYYQDAAGNFVQAPSGGRQGDDAGVGTCDPDAPEQRDDTRSSASEQAASEVAKGNRCLHATPLALIAPLIRTACVYFCRDAVCGCCSLTLMDVMVRSTAKDMEKWLKQTKKQQAMNEALEIQKDRCVHLLGTNRSLD